MKAEMYDQHIQVQAVVEVSAPKEMIKTKADVKRAELFFSERQELEDVLEVVVSPVSNMRNSIKLTFTYNILITQLHI